MLLNSIKRVVHIFERWPFIPKINMVNNSTGLKNIPNSSNGFLDLEINRIVWIDMEMTGLNVESDRILEVACLITDSDLNIVAEGPDIIIHQNKTILDNMNEWCINQHRKTGLTEASLNSKINLEAAENQLMEFIENHVTEKSSPLAGNSVYMDRLFLIKYMPKVHNYLHYRIIDVSTVKELCRRWNPKLYKEIPNKEYSHRALQDIKESVDELKFYKENFFNKSVHCNLKASSS